MTKDLRIEIVPPVWLVPPPAITDRRRYEHLSQIERDQLHAWLIKHDVAPEHTPINALIELDLATDEWRIEQFTQRNGNHYIDPATGHVACHIVRRVRRSDLPWPRHYGSATLRKHEDGTITVEQADDVVGITAELFDELEPLHKPDRDTLILDTAGTYRYHRIDHDVARDMLIFRREGTARDNR